MLTFKRGEAPRLHDQPLLEITDSNGWTEINHLPLFGD
jgi:hypothetical protein